MRTLAMRLTDEQLNTMVAWCKSNGIEYDVVGGNTLVPPTLTTTKASEPKNDTKNVDLGKCKCTVGFCNQYKNAIRYWENGFVPSKVKYGIKCALKESGAVWDEKLFAFKFKTIAEADTFMKAQKQRESLFGLSYLEWLYRWFDSTY